MFEVTFKEIPFLEQLPVIFICTEEDFFCGQCLPISHHIVVGLTLGEWNISAQHVPFLNCQTLQLHNAWETSLIWFKVQ